MFINPCPFSWGYFLFLWWGFSFFGDINVFSQKNIKSRGAIFSIKKRGVCKFIFLTKEITKKGKERKKKSRTKWKVLIDTGTSYSYMPGPDEGAIKIKHTYTRKKN